VSKPNLVSILMATFFSRTGIARDKATTRRFIAAAEEADRAGKVFHSPGTCPGDNDVVMDRLEWAIRAMEADAIAKGLLPTPETLNPIRWRAWTAADDAGKRELEEEERRWRERCSLAPGARRSMTRYLWDGGP